MKRPTKSLNIETNQLAKELHGTGFYHKLCHIYNKHGEERAKSVLKKLNNIFKSEAISNSAFEIRVKIEKNKK